MEAHIVPQVPQWLRSFVRSTHAAPHTALDAMTQPLAHE
jgi:hypothetical protein